MNETSVTHERSPLSSREREVLQLITEGRSYKEIANSLNICPKTIETHRRQILKKLKLTNLAELTRYAIREGISSL
jgi:DNA-binding NarL/FixJ family response regulator